jgi:hypothetical protein
VSIQQLVILGIASLATAGLHAQAWLPGGGEGSVSISYLGLFSSDHLLSSGQPQNRGPVRQNIVTAGVIYGITDRLTVSAEVPYIDSKFNLTPGLAPNAHDLESKVDDGRYRGTFQDFRVDLKFNATRRGLMFTPFLEAVVPSHSYVTFGHAAPGKDLRELHLGSDIGRLLNPFLPRAYFDLRCSYAFVQPLDGMNIDRTNADLEVGYFVKSTIAIRAIGSVQKTLGGLESPVSPDNPFFADHDRLERGHYSRMGAGLTLSVSRNIDLFFMIVTTLSGKNAQSFTAPGVGLSWNFRTRHARERLAPMVPDKSSGMDLGTVEQIAK